MYMCICLQVLMYHVCGCIRVLVARGVLESRTQEVYVGSACTHMHVYTSLTYFSSSSSPSINSLTHLHVCRPLIKEL